MDGDELTFADGAFDFVLCGYAIFWFPDLAHTLANFLRLLTPGGRVGISMFGGTDPRWHWYNQLIQKYGEKHVQYVTFGGNQINNKPGQLDAALHDAGFHNIQITIEEFEIVYPNAEEWWDAKWTHGSRAPLEQMTPELLAHLLCHRK